MQELKFRAWHNTYKKMYYNIMVGGLNETVPSYLDEDGDWVNLWGNNSDGIIMQYTGLKDKNGKEIYEGEILKIIIGDGLEEVEYGEYLLDADGALIEKFKEERVYIAYSKEDSYELKAFYKGGTKWDNGESYEDWDDSFYRLCHPESVESIGNIYENPELLKVKEK